MSTTWRVLPGESTQLYSPIGLRLLDELTGASPLGHINAFLDLQLSPGNWSATDIKAACTASGVISYPGLERHGDVSGLGPRHYRVRIEAEFYVPLYRRNVDGIEFNAFPYSDIQPPSTTIHVPQDMVLTPGPGYPFPSHVLVLRGKVVDNNMGKPVPDAVVTQGVTERVLTDARGTFALPLRWAPLNMNVAIDAADERTGRVGTIQVQLPGAISKSQTISIS